MNATNVWTVLRKDLRLGPRSPLVLWTVVLPVALTLLVRGVFGSLFDPQPRLGIVDLGDSRLTSQALALDGFDVVLLDDDAALREAVRGNAVDAGILLPPGFDAAVAAGERPVLDLRIAGESLASNRILLAVTTLDLVRGLAGGDPPVDVVVESLGAAGLGVDARLVPMLVIMAVAIAGVMVAAGGLVQEKERGTLTALLVTPISAHEVLAAKGILGGLLGVLTGLVTLALNGGFGPSPVVVVVAVVLGAVMMVEIGLVLGTLAKDTNTLFTAWKGGAMFLLFPVIVYVFPGVPTWIGRLGPTFWFLDPIFAVAVEGRPGAEVWWELVVAAAVCLALLPAVGWAARRLEGVVRLAAIDREPATATT